LCREIVFGKNHVRFDALYPQQVVKVSYEDFVDAICANHIAIAAGFVASRNILVLPNANRENVVRARDGLRENLKFIPNYYMKIIEGITACLEFLDQTKPVSVASLEDEPEVCTPKAPPSPAGESENKQRFTMNIETFLNPDAWPPGCTIHSQFHIPALECPCGNYTTYAVSDDMLCEKCHSTACIPVLIHAKKK
jgi:hypothetical protein